MKFIYYKSQILNNLNNNENNKLFKTIIAI